MNNGGDICSSETVVVGENVLSCDESNLSSADHLVVVVNGILRSYGGKIVWGSNGNELRYVGNTNGILAVDRDITCTELIIKLWDRCRQSMRLRCSLPGDDLGLLILITSDEDLAFIIKEYNRYGKDLKIRAILDDVPIFEEQMNDQVFNIHYGSCHARTQHNVNNAWFNFYSSIFISLLNY
uniref:uncharacterized protein LOC122585180 n=1 Tax=Erigeron canadensis TaxID=72917 RepID=UPI001CB90B15|nr:uncharacterized protein LOC122585180 [Erigeron canadensis]